MEGCNSQGLGRGRGVIAKDQAWAAKKGGALASPTIPRGFCSIPEGSADKKPALGLGLGCDVKAYAVILILKHWPPLHQVSGVGPIHPCV